MKYLENKVEDIKIAYIGGGSRGWAWGLMSDLAQADDISGSVYLYDIDLTAAKNNEIIGNKVNGLEGAKAVWKYKATETIEEALTGADFVVIAAPTNYDSKKNFFDTSAVENVIELVMKYAPDAIMVIKSTILVGYTKTIREKMGSNNIIFSPEFLRESKALYDNR